GRQRADGDRVRGAGDLDLVRGGHPGQYAAAPAGPLGVPAVPRHRLERGADVLRLSWIWHYHVHLPHPDPRASLDRHAAWRFRAEHRPGLRLETDQGQPRRTCPGRALAPYERWTCANVLRA